MMKEEDHEDHEEHEEKDRQQVQHNTNLDSSTAPKASALKKFWDFSNRAFEYFTRDESESSIQNNCVYDKREELMVFFLHPDVSKDIAREFLCNYLMDKGFRIEYNMGAKINAMQEYQSSPERRTLKATVGYNNNQEKMLHIKVKDEKDLTLSYFQQMFTEFGEYLASNNMLRSQNFTKSAQSSLQKQLKNGTESRIKDNLRQMSQNTYYKEGENSADNLFVIFLSKRVSREKIIEIILSFASEKGLTSKLQGKASVQAASAELIAVMKIGRNEKNERILHVQNDVSRFGGDKTGKKFLDFSEGLAYKLAQASALESQEKTSEVIDNMDSARDFLPASSSYQPSPSKDNDYALQSHSVPEPQD